jgi:hypothetical protein
MNSLNQPNHHPIEAPGYESGGQGVVVLTLAAALTSLIFILFVGLRAILAYFKSA